MAAPLSPPLLPLSLTRYTFFMLQSVFSARGADLPPLPLFATHVLSTCYTSCLQRTVMLATQSEHEPLRYSIILSMSICTPMQHVHSMCSCLLSMCWPHCSCVHITAPTQSLVSGHHVCPRLPTKGYVTDSEGCLVQGKGSREQGNLVVKEAVAAMMHKWNSAFRCGPSAHASCRHELP